MRLYSRSSVYLRKVIVRDGVSQKVVISGGGGGVGEGELHVQPTEGREKRERGAVSCGDLFRAIRFGCAHACSSSWRAIATEQKGEREG